MEAGLREEQPTPPPADSPQRHNSALSNAGCSSGAGASHVAPRRAYELTITVAGDTWRDVVERLKRLQGGGDLDIERLDPQPGDSGVALSAGYAGSYTVDVHYDPAMTHDLYYELLGAHLALLDEVPA